MFKMDNKQVIMTVLHDQIENGGTLSSGCGDDMGNVWVIPVMQCLLSSVTLMNMLVLSFKKVFIY